MTSEVLIVSELEQLVVPGDVVVEILEVPAETAQEILEVAEQGPIGPVGPDGDKGDKGDKGDTGDQGAPGADALPYGPSLNVDASRPVAYVGYATKIMRLDYTSYPPTKTLANTSSLATDWPNRTTLGYA